jgi:DNA polymerase III delta prime subunit
MAFESWSRDRITGLDDLALRSGIRAQLSIYLGENGLTQNLIFVGDTGNGKTTAANLFLADDRYDKNIIDWSGSDTKKRFRAKSHIDLADDLSSKRSVFGGPRLLFLDEFHNATTDDQKRLTNMLERPDTRWIIATNNYKALSHQIQSRCIMLRFDIGVMNDKGIVSYFDGVKEDDWKTELKRLGRRIAARHGVDEVSDDLLDGILSEGQYVIDIRRFVNMLQVTLGK